jgi:4-hydroxybenzoate polyprenyltransferase
MGAIAMREYDIVMLFFLFLVGFLGHTYGFALNDIIDFKIDKYSKEISDRPLVSGTISMRNATVFAVFTMVLAFVIAVYITFNTQRFYPLVILFISAGFITLYDLISKRYPFTDIFVAFGIFFLVLYGATTVVDSLYDVTPLAWIVCVLGSIQVLFMQMIAGGMKDIENDFRKGAKTLAIKMGVRIVNGTLKVSLGFKALAYSLQAADLIIVFLPFYLIPDFRSSTLLQYFQWLVIIFIGILMFFLSHKLLSMKRFERVRARKFIGSHYVTNFALVPVMLMSINPWAGLLIFFPALGFIISNIIVHGTLLQPKTM